MLIIGVKATKELPRITGNPIPRCLLFSVWRRVAMPHVNKSIATRYANSSAFKPSALPTSKGTRIAPAYIAKTC